MMRFRKFLPLAAALTMILGCSAPAASAAASTYVTRGQYVAQLLPVVGVQPLTSAAQNFSDVPSASPYFGYVEAAYHAGITTGMVAPAGGRMGVFGVGKDLTRAEAAAFDLRAYDGGVASYAQSASGLSDGGLVSFGDTGKVPATLRNAVYTAADIGLIRGLPDGTFGPQQNLTHAQTADLVAQLKALEATGGPYHWRWIIAANSGLAETSTANAMNFLADAVAGKPFSAVAGYIDPADATALQTAYAEIQKSAAANFNGGLDAGTANATIKIVGGGVILGEQTNNGGWYESANLLLEAVSNTSGRPSAVYGNSPYFRLEVPLDAGSSGLVSTAYPPVGSAANLSLTTGESVAGAVMEYLSGYEQISAGTEGSEISKAGYWTKCS